MKLSYFKIAISHKIQDVIINGTAVTPNAEYCMAAMFLL
jgi:hypothetical protein